MDIRTDRVRLRPIRRQSVRRSIIPYKTIVCPKLLGQRGVHLRNVILPIINSACNNSSPSSVNLAHTPTPSGISARLIGEFNLWTSGIELIVSSTSLLALVLGDHPGEVPEVRIDIRIDVGFRDLILRILAADEDGERPLDRVRHPSRQIETSADHLVCERRGDVESERPRDVVRRERARVVGRSFHTHCTWMVKLVDDERIEHGRDAALTLPVAARTGMTPTVPTCPSVGSVTERDSVPRNGASPSSQDRATGISALRHSYA